MLAVDDDCLLAAIRELTVDRGRAARYPLPSLLSRNFSALHAFARANPPLRFAFSVKTNPTKRVLAAALSAQCSAEVISEAEFRVARAAGFGRDVVYNGPVPAWRITDASLGMVFADSVEAYVENARRLRDAMCGFRLRPAQVRSRFGVPVEDESRLVEAITSSGRSTTGCSFHVRPEDYGPSGWRGIVAEALASVARIERATGVAVTHFDVGGGRTPQEFDDSVSAGDIAWLLGHARAALPSLEAVLMEPGQAVVTPCECVVAPIVETRVRDGRRDVVIDAGYPEFSQISTFEHRLFALTADGAISRIQGTGRDRVFGRTCLEYDVVASDVALPNELEAIVVADTGAYDHSMSFSFALGGNSDDRL